MVNYKAIAAKILEDTMRKEPAEAFDILLHASHDESLRQALIEDPLWNEWYAHFKPFVDTPEHLALVERINAQFVNNSVAKAFKRIQEITAIDGKSLEQRALKTCEEAGETAGAILGYVKAPGSEYKNKTLDDVIEENADTFICVLSVLAHAAPGVTLDKFMEVVHTKMDKWESKVKEQG